MSEGLELDVAEPAVGRRVRGPLLFVAVALVLAAVSVIVWRESASTEVTTTGAVPDAETEIRSMVERLFLQGPSVEQKLAAIDDPTGLRPVISQGLHDQRAGQLTLRLASVEVGAESATVEIEFFLRGALAATEPLEMTLVDGRWLARRDSYCALVATGGLHCDPVAEVTGGH